MVRSAQETGTLASHSRRPRDKRYTRVAIILHWLIAALIVYNLISGFVIWDFAKEFFQANRPFYVAGLISHISSGLTVLVLTVARIFWRLTHEPPPYPDDMKPWERHAAHFAHFFLYGAMLLMPLSGWAIVSANPPSGPPGPPGAASQAPRPAMGPPAAMTGAAAPSGVALPGPPSGPPGAALPQAPQAPMAPMAPMAPPVGGATGAPPPPGVAPPGRPPGPPRLWWVGPRLPIITPLQKLGAEPGGVAPQKILHDQIADWHKIGAWLTIFLLLLHVAGALKHQWVDRSPTLQRMGLGRWPKASQEPDA